MVAISIIQEMHFISKVTFIKQELSHDSIARLNCALPITKKSVLYGRPPLSKIKFVHLKINIDLGV